MGSPQSTTWMSLVEPLTQLISVLKVIRRSRFVFVVLSFIWISVAIFNPSNLNLSTGDLSKSYLSRRMLINLHSKKALQLFRDDAVLGTALLPNLTLNIGNNIVNSTSNFEVPYLASIVLRI